MRGRNKEESQEAMPSAAPSPPQGKTIYCKKCGQVIYKKVKRCPYCGEKNKRPPIAGLVVLAVIIVIIIAAVVNAPPAENREPMTPEGLQSALNSEFEAYNADFRILSIDADANLVGLAAITDDSSFDNELAAELTGDAIEFVIGYFRDYGRDLRHNTTIACALLVGEPNANIGEMWCIGVNVYVPEDNHLVYTEANMTYNDFWANYGN